MPTSDDRALVDANILVYALFPESQQHVAARALFERAQAGDLSLCLTPQVLAEFYAIVTDARRVTVARTSVEALDTITTYLAMPGLQVLPVPDDVVNRWIELVRRHPVTRGRIFDHQLVATMLANQVKRIYTYNRRDFEVFKELEVLAP